MFSIEPGQLVSDDPKFESIPFLSKEDLKDEKYSLYLFVQIDDYKELHLKFGEAKKETVFERYNDTSCVHNDHMIKLYSSEKGDREIHDELMAHSDNKRGYIWDGRKEDNCRTHTSESYLIPNVTAFYNFIKDLEEAINAKPLEKTHKDTYTDIIELVDEIYSKIA